MRTLASVTLIGTLAAPALAAQDAPSVTLFSNSRTLVRRTLPVRIPAGASIQPFSIGMFDPSSFTVLDPGVTVSRVSYDAAYTEDALLRRNIGQLFRISQGDGKPILHARLLGVAPERWEITATEPASALRGVVFGRPGQLLWGNEQVPSGPVADVMLNADRARNTLRVMYEAPGGSWNASYRLFLGGDGRVEGVANIAAGGLDLADAEVQLLAGDIGRKVAAPMAREMTMARAADAYASGAPENEAVGEARLYTLPGRVSFVPGAMLSVPLFAPTPVQGQLRLTVGGALGFWGGVDQYGDEMDVPVQVSYRFDRKQGTPFGDLPLPAGSLSVYQSDRGGRVQLVGQGSIGHTAPGEMIEVATGTAFDVSARRTQTNFSTAVLANPRRTVATVDYAVVVKNAKDSVVNVEVREDRGGEWSVVSSSVAAVKRSSSRVVFPLTVPARGEVTLTYRLRVVW